jgi:hypothetical protein
MAKPNDVMRLLCQGVVWTITGEKYEDIIWHEGKPAITKKQFDDGFAKFDEWQAKQDVEITSAKSALLAKLGITEDEAKLLLG